MKNISKVTVTLTIFYRFSKCCRVFSQNSTEHDGKLPFYDNITELNTELVFGTYCILQ